MRIALIAHNLRGGGGISVGRNLIAAMGRVAGEHKYFVSAPSGLGYEKVIDGLKHGDACFTPSNSSLVDRLKFETMKLRRNLKDFRPHVILGLGNQSVGNLDAPQVILCHNSYLWYPAKHFGSSHSLHNTKSTLLRVVKKRRFARDLRHASLVLCQTKTAERRIRAKYQFTAPTAIVPNAVSEFVEQSTAIPVPEAYRELGNREVFFCLCRYYPHKNLEIFIDLFQQHSEELKNSVVILTIAAEHHPGAAQLLRRIDRLGLSEHIINIGPVPQSQLQGYYEHATALLFPTLLESFSGTYLEAMQLGCPILTSDLDFAHEICGTGALYFDPWNPTSIMATIQEFRMTGEHRIVEEGRNRLQTMYRSWNDIALNLIARLRGTVPTASD